MLYIGKELPQMDIDENEYKPFIRHEWFRRNYMWFAYGLMILLFITALSLGRLRAGHFMIRLVLFAITYLVHELLHIAWINSIIAGSDIINSTLILMMPRNSFFYRGYYKNY